MRRPLLLSMVAAAGVAIAGVAYWKNLGPFAPEESRNLSPPAAITSGEVPHDLSKGGVAMLAGDTDTLENSSKVLELIVSKAPHARDLPSKVTLRGQSYTLN